MKIELSTDKNEWENWLILQKYTEFLQSFAWGDFQKDVGREVIRVNLEDKSGKVGQFQGIVHRPVPGLRYLYIPRPDKKTMESLSTSWESDVKPFLKEQKIDFVRLEPGEPVSGLKLPKNILTKNVQAHTTLVLDVTPEEGDLMLGMHSKTRYNIRLAKKKGVVVKQEKNLETYWNLCQTTKTRDGFSTHPKSYYKKMLDLDFVIQLTAYFEDKPIVSNICINYNKVFTYLHGASANQYRNVMAPYLVQWEAMLLAKSLGCTHYDFWGVAPMIDKDAKRQQTCFNNFCWQPDHKYTGFTRFKAGFGGEYKEYPQAMDLVLSPLKYKAYKFFRQVIRKLKK